MPSPCATNEVREASAIDLTSPALSAIRRTSAVDTVRARIALAVELGLVVPGERLPSPDETAAAFGVSGITVRRAYRLLQEDDVIVLRRGQGGGAFIGEQPVMGTVPSIADYRSDTDRVHALIDQRAVLETGLAHLAATARQEEQLQRMEVLLRRMDEVDNWAEFREADIEFHEVLARSSQLPAALELHHRVSRELSRYFLPYPMEYLRGSNREHAAIAEALRSKDAELAARLAGAHVLELHTSMYVGRATSPHPTSDRP